MACWQLGVGLGLLLAAGEPLDLSGPWTLTGGPGTQAAGPVLSLTGSGTDTHAWRSGRLALTPGETYELTFRARGDETSGGTPVTGPEFANRDLGSVGADWQAFTTAFRVPQPLSADESFVRFGQWMLKGRLQFDSLRLRRATPLHTRRGGVELGAGETLVGHTYRCTSPLGGDWGNTGRALDQCRCRFNSNRWVFGADSYVVYRHALPGRRQTAGTVEVNVNWHHGGRLRADVSADGQTWRPLGTVGAVGTGRWPVPGDLLPADTVFVRLAAEAGARVGTNSDPGSFQVDRYVYEATVTGEPVDLAGHSSILAIEHESGDLAVRPITLGEGLPGGDNRFQATVDNRGPARELVLTLNGAPAARTTLAPGAQSVDLAYEVPDAGVWAVGLRAGEWQASGRLSVAELYRSGYGQRLPGTSDAVGVWGCSSGYKVSRTRPVPVATAPALTLQAARGEAEAAQVVLRPRQALRGLTATATVDGLPGALDVRRVGYVNVSQPTDSTGVQGLWPDPLFPLTTPVDLAANTNQPLWLRVSVPRDAPAGVHRGTLTLTAEGWRAEVPLSVEVFGFTLPETATCRSGFGFDPHLAFRYQGVTDPAEQRVVLDKYLTSFATHRISPYNPTPLDHFQVTWPRSNGWQGGRRVTDEHHGGASCRMVVDDSPTASVSLRWEQPVPIPATGGLRLRLWYKTKTPGHRFIVTLGHLDATGTWMSGRNNDLQLTGDGTWQLLDRTLTTFPPGARSVTLSLWATLWADNGAPTGTVWYDDVSLTRVVDGQELLSGGDFEQTGAAADLTPRFDFARWDAAMEQAFARYHFNAFTVPIQGMGGGTFDGRTEPELLGYHEGDPEYTAAFDAYCRGLEQHLADKGWLDQAYVYWFDEPDRKDFPFVMKGMRRLKQHAPRLWRLLTKEVDAELLGGPNLWCPLTPLYREDSGEARRKLGERFWWYICCGPKAPYCTEFIDHPGTEQRVWLWQTWQRGVQGILIWQTNYWTSPTAYPQGRQDPYTDPMSWVSGYHTPTGARIGWGNGDGRFLYPGLNKLDGPVESLRWELLRDGVEDYEYLTLLADAVAKLPADRRGMYADLLTVPRELTTDMTTFTRDPGVIERRREAVARALEALSTRR